MRQCRAAQAVAEQLRNTSSAAVQLTDGRQPAAEYDPVQAGRQAREQQMRSAVPPHLGVVEVGLCVCVDGGQESADGVHYLQLDGGREVSSSANPVRHWTPISLLRNAQQHTERPGGGGQRDGRGQARRLSRRPQHRCVPLWPDAQQALQCWQAEQQMVANSSPGPHCRMKVSCTVGVQGLPTAPPGLLGLMRPLGVCTETGLGSWGLAAGPAPWP